MNSLLAFASQNARRLAHSLTLGVFGLRPKLPPKAFAFGKTFVLAVIRFARGVCTNCTIPPLANANTSANLALWLFQHFVYSNLLCFQIRTHKPLAKPMRRLEARATQNAVQAAACPRGAGARQPPRSGLEPACELKKRARSELRLRFVSGGIVL